MSLAYVITYVVVFVMFFIGVFTSMTFFAHAQPTMNILVNPIRYGVNIRKHEHTPNIIIPEIHSLFDKRIALVCCQLVENLYVDNPIVDNMELYKIYSYNESIPKDEEKKSTSTSSSFGSVHVHGDTMFIAFRGTTVKLNEWVNNMKYYQVSSGDTRDILPSMMNNKFDAWDDTTFIESHRDTTIMIHAGWARLAGKLSKSVCKQVEKLYLENPNISVVLSGHSMGGCVAMILVAELATLFPDVKFILYTFGCPRVGNYAFVQYVKSLKNLVVYRVVNGSDMLPELMPAVAPNYTNPDRPYFYNHCGTVYTFDENLLSIANNHSDITYKCHFQ